MLICSPVSMDSPKLHSLVDQTGTYVYNASKVVSKYLCPVTSNEFPITDTLSFPDLLISSSNYESYEGVSYNVEMIDYILQRIYVCKKIKSFCKKSIFKKFLLKLTKECIFSVKLIKQTDGCPMEGQIFMTLKSKKISLLQ